MKVCNVCQEEKSFEFYCKHATTKDGRSNICTPCKSFKQKIKRQESNNEYSKAYEKTKQGFLVRCYRNMLSRVTGVQPKGNYFGKDILEKEHFYYWSLNDKEFNTLFEVWVKGGYLRKSTPSIDRIDSRGGYTVHNIRWLTHSENSRLGSISPYRPHKYKTNKMQTT